MHICRRVWRNRTSSGWGFVCHALEKNFF